MLTSDESSFAEDLPGFQTAFRQEIEGRETKPLLLSHEGFLRSTRFGGHDLRRTAERIHQVFVGAFAESPDTEIVICLRNQPDLILSHFIQFVKGTQDDLDRHVGEALADPRRGFPGSLFYSDLLDHYARLFGKEKLHLLTFEDFVADRDRFLKRLSLILGIDPRTSAPLLGDKHEKQRSKEAGSYALPDRHSLYFKLGRLLKAMRLEPLASQAKARAIREIALSATQRRDLEDLYRASNSAVEAAYGIDLAGHGYPTGANPA